MKIEKRITETYVLTELVDTITVYVTSYDIGQGKIVIECCGMAWACYFPDMGARTLEEFILEEPNECLLSRFLAKTSETDFDEINELAKERGFGMHVATDFDLGFNSADMEQCFGDGWMFRLPKRQTSEYRYLFAILSDIKDALHRELSLQKRIIENSHSTIK